MNQPKNPKHDWWPPYYLRIASDPQVARVIGINESIMLRIIYDNTSEKNASWLRITREQWLEAMPWLSITTLKRIVERLVDQKLIERKIDTKFGNAYRPIHNNVHRLVNESHSSLEIGYDE
jgi:hypothetical protein